MTDPQFNPLATTGSYLIVYSIPLMRFLTLLVHSEDFLQTAELIIWSIKSACCTPTRWGET